MFLIETRLYNSETSRGKAPEEVIFHQAIQKTLRLLLVTAGRKGLHLPPKFWIPEQYSEGFRLFWKKIVKYF